MSTTAKRSRASTTSINSIMLGWMIGIFPHRVLISFFLITEYWLLIGHWRQQRIRNQESENAREV
jgi:hypothetical protein